jgi:hypothetical protein
MATAESYFRTRVTRPFRWAIPLAIVGYVLLILLPLVGAVVSHSSCVPSTTVIQQTQTHTVIQRQVINRGCFSSSPSILLTGVAMPLFVLCQLPALFFFIRGLLWAANSLFDLRQRADTP